MLTSRLAAATIAGLALSAGWAGATAASAAIATPARAAQVKSASPAVASSGAWTVYHRDNAHTGFDSTQPPSTGATAGWVSGTMDDQVYAEPLVFNGVVYAATLGNTVYAFDQSTGATLWHMNLGAPQTSGWSCGNIPRSGILGTPVIDTVANRLYAVGEVTALTPTYYLYGLDLANNGNVVLQTPITWSGFDWAIQQERGALALSADRTHVYVPFGGRWGDCGSYHGYVFGVPTNGTAIDEEWNTPNTAGAGIWSTGGVVVDDSTGKVFVTTGNGGCPTANDNFNDSVVRLTATLALDDYFFPADWHDAWNCPDEDLGSVSTVLISPTLAFQAGKYGTGFLLNPQNLGGDTGQLFPTPKPAAYVPVDVCLGNHHDANFGSYAYAAPYVYLSCEGNGMVGLKVNTVTPSFSPCDAACAAPSWNTGGVGTQGPPIVAGGVVWSVNAGGGGGLYGFDAATGAQIYHSSGFFANRFSTPSEAGGQIFVGSGNQIRSFNMTNGCTSAMLAAAPPASAPTGSTVNLTATASGGNCVSPQFRFWIQPPGGSYSIVQDYSSTNTYSWTTTGLAGQYHIAVHVRSLGSPVPYETSAGLLYTLNGCSGAGLTALPGSPQAPGPTVVLTASSTCSGTATYRFWVKPPGGAWGMVRDYGTSNTFSWNTAALAQGGYGLVVHVRNQGATAAYETYAYITYLLAVGPCATPSLGANPPSAAATGATVTFTASTSGCPSPRYRFWVGQNGGWTILQDYSPTNTFSWLGTGLAGTYGIEVDVRDASSSVAYDHVTNISYTLNPCSIAGISASPPSPRLPGPTVTVTGSATCPGTPTYRFWVKPPGGAWGMVRDYSTSNMFSWNTAALAQGSYGLVVHVRNQGATAAYETYAYITYLLAAVPCTTPSLGANPPAMAATGATVVFTASTSGCPTPNYRFWVGQNGGWTILQDYSPTNTFSWHGTGVAGAYGIEVDVRDASSSVAYDHVANIGYTLVACSGPHLVTDKASPQAHGTTIVLTGSASCPGTPEYRFWVRGLNGAWTIVRDFNATNTFSWNTTGLAPGIYGLEVDVRNQGSTAAYETVANITFQVT